MKPSYTYNAELGYTFKNNLNFSAFYSYSDEDVYKRQAHLALNDGTMFGVPGEGFMRLNIGCPRSVLEQALKQLRDAVVQ